MDLRTPSSPAETLAFVLFAAVALAGALATVSLRNPIRCAVGLFFHVIALSGMYLALGAHFLGVIQLLVYAGAIVVLFVFVIMLIGPDATTARDHRHLRSRFVSAAAVAGATAMVLSAVAFVRMPMYPRPLTYGTLARVGFYLFRDAAVPFELVGVTLVIAVVGAFAVARGHHSKRDARIDAGDAAAAGREAVRRDGSHS